MKDIILASKLKREKMTKFYSAMIGLLLTVGSFAQQRADTTKAKATAPNKKWY